VKIKVVSDSDKLLIISIQDNGKGMEAGDLEKIFNPFFTTREQGTGLGLAIVKRIVELHGGSISASSQLGKWTRFLIKLNQQGSLFHG
jgi:signal transduction histidine kinase